jgi:hypothetical protein
MKLKKLNIAIVGLFLATSLQQASATIIDFNVVDPGFGNTTTTTQDGYTFTKSNDGMATVGAGIKASYWSGNGTGRLLSYTNSGSESGFTLADQGGSSFSLSSFDYANGYVSGLGEITSLNLTGVFSGGGTISQSILNDTSNWNTVFMSSAWSNLTAVSLIANGYKNRAMWDNIAVNEAFNEAVNEAAVPEPSTTVLMGLGMLLLSGVAIRRKRS